MLKRQDYLRDGAAIYERSFAIIRAEADLSRFAPEEADDRRAHDPCLRPGRGGQASSNSRPASSPPRAAALARGAPILCDAEMVAHGVTRARLPANNEVVCTLRDPRTPELAAELGTTRSAAALELWRDRLAGAVVAIGNAPTALFRLLDMLADGGAAARGDHRHAGRLRRRGRIQGRARRQSLRRAVADRARPHGRQRHDRGGGQRSGEGRSVSTQHRPSHRRRRRSGRSGAADAEGGRARSARPMWWRISPSPATRAMRATIVARASATGADRAAAALSRDHRDRQIDDAYRDAIRDFYDEAAETRRRAPRSRAARSRCSAKATRCSTAPTCICMCGWRTRFPTEIIPGVTAMSGCWSATGMPIVQGDDVLTVLPGTLPEYELARRLADTDAAVIMKVGRNLPKCAARSSAPASSTAPSMSSAAPWPTRRSMRLADKPDDLRALFRHGAGAGLGGAGMSGHLTVIGLGPGDDRI